MLRQATHIHAPSHQPIHLPHNTQTHHLAGPTTAKTTVQHLLIQNSPVPVSHNGPGPIWQGLSITEATSLGPNSQMNLPQFSDLQQSYDSWQIHRTFATILRSISRQNLTIISQTS